MLDSLEYDTKAYFVLGGAVHDAAIAEILALEKQAVSASFINMLVAAKLIAAGAFTRTESRGAHAHEDYTTRDDVNWRKHTLAWVDGNKVRLDYRPVHTQPLTSEQEGGISMKKIAPAERKF